MHDQVGVSISIIYHILFANILIHDILIRDIFIDDIPIHGFYDLEEFSIRSHTVNSDRPVYFDGQFQLSLEIL